ncbi:MAG: aminoacyl-tRNA hydrolase [Deltaproteobacteria bacterium]|uniref:Peptidyl-tRNA hydrolase n=1 Tax=Candidatus Zymogenus saltonus TaxID=2844893 RepID=A0A9D8KEQ8_9DELT|nr:aminoacyl-tRNA hydrolase [Candidatus Zymogenus saltonus]
MKAIFGLGNPGREYKKTRHNVGFMVVSSFGEEIGISIKKRKFNTKIGIGKIGEIERDKRGDGNGGGKGNDGGVKGKNGGGKDKAGDETLLLALPQTYMNRSGYSVSAVLDFYRLSPKDIIVVSDDVDLDFGRIRIRPRGGSGGHRGMKSIIDELGTSDFIRLRIGIGRDDDENTADFVLGRFSSNEALQLEDIIERAKESLFVILHDGVDFAMNRFNE